MGWRSLHQGVVRRAPAQALQLDEFWESSIRMTIVRHQSKIWSPITAFLIRLNIAILYRMRISLMRHVGASENAVFAVCQNRGLAAGGFFDF